MLAVWIVAHWLVVPILVWGVFPPSSRSLPWVAFFAVFPFSPLYVYVVHKGDSQWRMGGLLSLNRWLERTPPKDGNKEQSESDPRLRPGLARMTLQITTGFAVVLAYQTVNYYRDLSRGAPVPPFLDFSLAALATLFVLACVSNLIQILIHHILTMRTWDPEQQNTFRRNLRILRALS